ncbi:MAG: polysaccharide deacetylase family protein [Opitutaceae bacterium]
MIKTETRILTIDVEEWFHSDMYSDPSTWVHREVRLPDNLDRILELLERRRVKATFFCLGWVARRHPEQVRKIVAQGHELGCHSDSHRLVHGLEPKTFEQDTRDALAAIEDVSGQRVRAYRAPAFSITPACAWAFEVLCACGFETDASIFPAERDFGGWPGFGEARPTIIETSSGRLHEFPINVVHALGRSLVFSGGGYFRLVPYRVIRRWTRRSRYVMSYFHPRDFDPRQPDLPELGAARRLKSYLGLRGAFAKFERWLADFSFVSLGEAAARVDWEACPVIPTGHARAPSLGTTPCG